LYTDESRSLYKYNVRYRLIPTAFGEYNGKKCFEIEEVSAGTKDLSFREYLEMREVFFYVYNVYSNVIYKSIIDFIITDGKDVVDFILYMMKGRAVLSDTNFAKKVVDQYIRDTREELFTSGEEVIDFFKKDKNWNKLLNGEMGKNLTHTYRAFVLMNSTKWAEHVIESFKSFVHKYHQEDMNSKLIIDKIIRHVEAQAGCQYRIFSGKTKPPSKEDPIATKEGIYYMKDDAIEYMRKCGNESRLIDLALVILRMDQKYTIPHYEETKLEHPIGIDQ
jgi:hypothetical protein